MENCFPLKLPEVKTYNPDSITEMYGAAIVASRYCGMRDIPRIFHRYWQHGWVQKSRQLEPDLVAAEPISNKKSLIFVARKDEEDYLIKEGYQAKAIGLPFCYVPSQRYSRIKNSLLVMPCHTSRFVPIKFNDDYNFFVRFILDQRKEFNPIYICMHQEDIDLGYAKLWEKAGFKVIRGAAIDDANALMRIHALMSQFETILSDIMGSHIVYAASLGAKISLFPPCGREYDTSRDPFFQSERTALRKLLDDIADAEMDPKASPYSFLFDEPKTAKQHIEWGLEQIGASNRVSPSELQHFLGWNLPTRLSNKLIDFNKRIIGKVKITTKKFVLKSFR
jgi:hypothetical protein